MLVEVKDLARRFDKLTAVDRVHFSIPAGGAFGLLGPNGPGKTTTVSMMCGLVVPSGGDVIIDGHSILREPMAVRRVIGAPQDIALYPTLSGRENLVFFAHMQDVPADTLASRLDAVLDIVQLADRQKDRVENADPGNSRNCLPPGRLDDLRPSGAVMRSSPPQHPGPSGTS
ncbi:MAG: ATP-binding cassette domain-containing protein [Candidatus Cryosericum sp.]|nr:ATP-binding cassette domain-containing protein [bacterium]